MMTKNDIKLIAEAERMMDDGEVQYVILGGQRVMVRQEAMREFSLRHGQTINDVVFTELLKWNIADLEAKLAEQKLRSGGEAQPSEPTRSRNL